jgi:hypothetical protein
MPGSTGHWKEKLGAVWSNQVSVTAFGIAILSDTVQAPTNTKQFSPVGAGLPAIFGVR